MNTNKKPKQKPPEEIIRKIRKHANSNARYLKRVDIVKTLREMRYEGKW